MYLQAYRLWLTYDDRTDDITIIVVYFENIRCHSDPSEGSIKRSPMAPMQRAQSISKGAAFHLPSFLFFVSNCFKLCVLLLPFVVFYLIAAVGWVRSFSLSLSPLPYCLLCLLCPFLLQFSFFICRTFPCCDLLQSLTRLFLLICE